MIKFAFLALFSFVALAGDPSVVRTTPDGATVQDMLELPQSLPSLTWANDPFEKLPGYSGTETEEEEYELSGTLGEDRSGAAIIGDRVVSVGDKIGSRKLRKVGSNYVLLEKGGSVIEVPLKAGEGSESPTRSIASVPTEEKAPVLRIEEVKE